MDTKQAKIEEPQHSTKDKAASTAIVIGASGGLGAGFVDMLSKNAVFTARYSQILRFSRSSSDQAFKKTANEHSPPLDYSDESTLQNAAAWTSEHCQTAPIRLLIIATGYLHSNGNGPERSLQQLDAGYLQHVMQVNAIGPALVLKHFAPLFPKAGELRIAFISAKVGSIGDNALGGWYGYRAAKAALNQIVKTASIELARRNKQTLCIALHPGTVATPLSDPFSKSGLNVRSPEVAAAELLHVIHQVDTVQTGGFFDYLGSSLPW